MEQARDWMWAKRKHCLRSWGDYWEEQAFVEDTAGSLGGCTWPPRSYSCSFCRREFRSAQALGGHMNVHRRDKARLNQPPTPPQTEILPHQIRISPSASLYDPNPNTNTNHDAAVIIASSLSPFRISTPSNTQGNYCEQTWVSPSYSSSSSIILHQHTKGSPFSPPPSWSDSVAVRVVTVSDSKKIEGEKNWRVEEDVGVDWNFVVPRNQPAGSGGGGEEEAAFITKRRRSDDISSPLPYFLNSISVDRHHLQSEVLGICTNPKEDLDLELRLGDGPKVK